MGCRIKKECLGNILLYVLVRTRYGVYGYLIDDGSDSLNRFNELDSPFLGLQGTDCTLQDNDSLICHDINEGRRYTFV